MAAAEFDHDFLKTHLDDERRRASLLGEIREAIFGAQDGLVSTLAVVSTVAGATSDRYVVLVAGIASALAGIFSMAAGEYIGSKSQREIFDAQIADEREEVHRRPGEAEAEVAFMFEEDGLPHDQALAVAALMARHPDVLLKTMVEKELGLAVEEGGGSPLQGALVMGGAFAVGSLPPILPHLFLLGGTAVVASVLATLAVLFGIGALKSRWTHRSWWTSGLEIMVARRVGRDRRLLLRQHPADHPGRARGRGLDSGQGIRSSRRHPEQQHDRRGHDPHTPGVSDDRGAKFIRPPMVRSTSRGGFGCSTSGRIRTRQPVTVRTPIIPYDSCPGRWQMNAIAPGSSKVIVVETVSRAGTVTSVGTAPCRSWVPRR